MLETYARRRSRAVLKEKIDRLKSLIEWVVDFSIRATLQLSAHMLVAVKLSKVIIRFGGRKYFFSS